MMRKIILPLILIGFVLIASPAQAANGGQIFQANCAVCHANGGNRIMVNKTLQKDVLAKYNMDSKEAIVQQIINGKNAMPNFRGRLNSSQIEAVADYVLSKAEQGW